MKKILTSILFTVVLRAVISPAMVYTTILVNRNAWECMNKVKTELITEFSKNIVLATNNLGKD